jgi:prepilin-type N-terminal cleavage/methylation domain-containing protein
VNKRRGGFSVVELLVAVAIVSIVAAGVRQTAVAYFAHEEQKKKNIFMADVVSISQGVFYYSFFEGKPPSSYQDLVNQGYVLGDGLSPWGTPYTLIQTRSGWKVIALDKKGQEHVYEATAKR